MGIAGGVNVLGRSEATADVKAEQAYVDFYDDDDGNDSDCVEDSHSNLRMEFVQSAKTRGLK